MVNKADFICIAYTNITISVVLYAQCQIVANLCLYGVNKLLNAEFTTLPLSFTLFTMYCCQLKPKKCISITNENSLQLTEPMLFSFFYCILRQVMWHEWRELFACSLRELARVHQKLNQINVHYANDGAVKHTQPTSCKHAILFKDIHMFSNVY